MSSGSGTPGGWLNRVPFDSVGPDTPHRASSVRTIQVLLLELFAQRPSTKDLLRRCDHGRDETWVGLETLIRRLSWRSFRRLAWRSCRGIGRRWQHRFLGLAIYGNQRGRPSPFRRVPVIVPTRHRHVPHDRADHCPPPPDFTHPPRCCVAQIDGRRPPNRASRNCRVIATITGCRVASLQQNRESWS